MHHQIGPAPKDSVASLNRHTAGLLVALGFLGCQTEEAHEEADASDASPDDVGFRAFPGGPADAAGTLGFENPALWVASSGQKASSTDATHGQALALSGLSGYVPLHSAPLDTSAPEFDGFGPGARISIDLKLPHLPGSTWDGALQMYVSAPSKGIYNAYLGQHDLTPLQKGEYVTLRFLVPEPVGTTLAASDASDLTFAIALNVPYNSPGTYLLDHLRIGGMFPQGGAETIQPGESVLIRAWRGYGDEQDRIEDLTVDGIIQIPQSFHVEEGNAGSGSLRFELGRGTLASCTYVGDPTTGGAHYQFSSCDDGGEPGELRSVSRVRVTVVDGDGQGPRTKVRGQLALNPMGDELGSIAPIPTYFGKTAAEGAAIRQAHIEAQAALPLTDGAKYIRMPTPDFGFQHEVINNDVEHLPIIPPESLDPPFSQQGSLTGSDWIDARWSIGGRLDIEQPAPNTRRTVVEASLSTRAYLLTYEAHLASVSAHASSTLVKDPEGGGSVSGYAHFGYNILGILADDYEAHGEAEIPPELFPAYEEDIRLFTLPYWVFEISADAMLVARAPLTVDFLPYGVGLSVTPELQVDVSMTGRLGVGGFLGGGVYGQVNLVSVSLPISLGVEAPLNAAPNVCTINPQMTFSAALNLGAGGGHIGYFLEGGVTCGYWDTLCWRTEGVLLPWEGFTRSYPLTTAVPLLSDPIPWFPEDCPGDIDVSIVDPRPTDSILAGTNFFVNISATRLPYVEISPDLIPIPEELDCVNGGQPVVTLTPDMGDTIVPTEDSCSYRVQLSTTPGPRQISVEVSDTYGHGADSRTVTVEPLPANQPPIPSVTARYPIEYCDHSHPQENALFGTFVYPGGDANNVRLFWYAEEEGGYFAQSELGEGWEGDATNPALPPFELDDPAFRRTYWLVAQDVTQPELFSSVPITIAWIRCNT